MEFQTSKPTLYLKDGYSVTVTGSRSSRIFTGRFNQQNISIPVCHMELISHIY